ncbi:hypothetical protein A0H81_01207 [Grifola frondosa]|uniref:Conserved oligomeric Golgi complex subunit 1 n=1 Tax=Grifola frondosa TaxID=5627 RepID=A0A1C7MRF8_GRIFR|nr:hypothetical protein A0H81_01207 [Grifola frondosa]
MARRPSTVSLGSLPDITLRSVSNLAGPSSNGSTGIIEGHVKSLPRSTSSSTKLNGFAGPDGSTNEIDPDELFTKHTVSEVKAIQRRLRNNADAKQEELRLMVGERYRDLLQASTSIISIARSSHRVLDALNEMQDIVASAQLPVAPKRASGGEDKHLYALQSLSAHTKLLLDAPEHLWRLMERKMYLHAAWLFLLARVVHRALSREDEEQSWHAYGIDVSEQMPLIQRQWDSVSQFRAQIAHKATLSLREPASSPSEVCAILLTLHLLESRPLPETLSIFLSQRSKVLSTLLAYTDDHIANGHTSSASKPNGKPSHKPRKTVSFPSPAPSIRSYQPYVDSASLSSSIPQVQFHQKLETWFHDAVGELQLALDKWFSDLEYLREVWDIRSSSMNWVESATNLEASEKENIKSALDASCHRQAVAVWKAALAVAESTFREQLASVLRSIEEHTDHSIMDTRPVQYLFHAPPTPSFTKAGITASLAAASFTRYKSTLRQQVIGRTPLLDAVLSILESRASVLQDDLISGKGDDQHTRALITRLSDAYRCDAEALCENICVALETAANDIADHDKESSIQSSVFISRIAEELSLSSSFIANIGCSPSVESERMSALCDRSIERWQEYTISKVIKESRLLPHVHSGATNMREPDAAILSHPSSALMQALLSLSTSLQQLGISLNILRQQRLAVNTLRRFVMQWLDYVGMENTLLQSSQTQLYWDLLFLRKLAILWGTEFAKIVQRIDGSISSAQEKLLAHGVTAIQLDLDNPTQQYLSRTQVLLAPLLPPPAMPTPTSPVKGKPEKPASLLYHGVPVVDQQFESAVELVKPSPRFGLLLVGALPYGRYHCNLSFLRRSI